MHIMADNREHEFILETLKAALAEDELTIMQMPVGDYAYDNREGGTTILCRKSISDFYNSLLSGHLEEELNDCLALCNDPRDNVYFFWEDNFVLSNRGLSRLEEVKGKPHLYHQKGVRYDTISPQRFNGLLTVMQSKGVQVMFSPGLEYTPAIIVREAERALEEPGKFMQRKVRQKHPWNIDPRVARLMDIWDRLPLTVARELIRRYKSPWGTVQQFIEGDYATVKFPGIGPGLVRTLRKGLEINS